MRVVVNEFMSLDGVVQAPGGAKEDTDGGFAHGGWSMPYFDPEVMGAAVGEVMERSDALLFGRRTWDGMAAAWPGRAGDPYADQMNSIKKYVASRTLSAEEAASRWNNTTLLENGADGDAIAAVLVSTTSHGSLMLIRTAASSTRRPPTTTGPTASSTASTTAAPTPKSSPPSSRSRA